MDSPTVAAILTVAIPAVCTMFSAVLVAWITHRNDKEKKQNAEAAAEKARADAAEKQLREEHEQQERERLQVTLDSMQRQINSIETQLTHVSTEMAERMAHAEESINSIVAILSKNARAMSQMMHMHTQTENRLQALMEIEGYNMRFTNETSTTLRAIGEIMAGALLDPEDAKKINAKIDDNTKAHTEFIDQIIEKQKDFFTEPLATDDQKAEKEIREIEEIVRHSTYKKKNNED